MQAALSIAGSDSGGGAGIQADLKTFEAHGVFGTTVLAALTAQNTVGVDMAMPVPLPMLEAQLSAILKDFDIGAAKTGMLFDAERIALVGDRLRDAKFPIVTDPVMVATSGDRLLEEDALEAMKKLLLPIATVITPNLREAEILTGMSCRKEADMEAAGAALRAAYPNAWILLKGGHTQGEEARDLLLGTDHTSWLSTPRIDTQDTHGSGCTLSAAITANLVKGLEVPAAVQAAKTYLTEAIRQAWTGLGKGRGSLRHHYRNLVFTHE